MTSHTSPLFLVFCKCNTIWVVKNTFYRISFTATWLPLSRLLDPPPPISSARKLYVCHCEVCITWFGYNSSLYRWRASVCLVHIVPLPYIQTIEAHFITLALGALFSGGGAESSGVLRLQREIDRRGNMAFAMLLLGLAVQPWWRVQSNHRCLTAHLQTSARLSGGDINSS